MSTRQSFADLDAKEWGTPGLLPGVELLPLVQPVPECAIYRARLAKGTVVPVHTHPADEYVYVMSGTVETGGRKCEAGTLWKTPGGSRQGPHAAITDAELLTIRLGALGPFGEVE